MNKTQYNSFAKVLVFAFCVCVCVSYTQKNLDDQYFQIPVEFFSTVQGAKPSSGLNCMLHFNFLSVIIPGAEEPGILCVSDFRE